MSTQANPLPRRRLGRTELEVTCLGMGGAGLGRGGVTDDEAIEAVHRAIDLESIIWTPHHSMAKVRGG